MEELDFKFWSRVRRFIFLLVLMVGAVLIFSTTKSMIKTVGFDNLTGASIATDRRTVYLLISLFGFVGYFVETIFERKYSYIKEKNNKQS